MDSQSKSMFRKRERHFNEIKTIISVALFLFGATACICLVFIWPQLYSIQVFNSKLMYKLIIDTEDYFTCDKDYKKFVIDEPDTSYSMISFYVFGVSNPNDVFQRGYKPSMVETGPFGFLKYTYRYDISFDDPRKSTTISFKEYSILNEIRNPMDCQDMFYRSQRDLLVVDPCINDKCLCKDYDMLITMMNPFLLKILWEESASDLLAHYSVEVFTEQKRLLEDPFTEAVKAHLVSRSYKEVYLFRIQMQSALFLNTAVTTLLNIYDLSDISDKDIKPSSCGLEIYGISSCPFKPYVTLANARRDPGYIEADCPSILPFLYSDSNSSFLNIDYGLPKWLAISWYYGYVGFNGLVGYSTITPAQVVELLNELAFVLAENAWGSGTAYTNEQIEGSKHMVLTTASWLSTQFFIPYASKFQSLVQQEWLDGYEKVTCSPIGTKCIWQFGYLKHYENVDFTFNSKLLFYLIDTVTEVSTNPISFYKDTFAPGWYNVYQYCQDVYNVKMLINITCTNLAYTFHDAQLGKPAALWSKEKSFASNDPTYVEKQYLLLTTTLQQHHYFEMSCNLSFLLHVVYRKSTDFHDIYVIDYINKNKDSKFNHTFSRDNWYDLGIAQWGAGIVTDAIAGVRSTYQVNRDGMWRFGEDKYYTNYLEYSSWAVKQGFPQAWIYNINDARLLLHTLANRGKIGYEFRKMIVYQGTTLIGDGKNYVNGVGNIGELTFILEANLNSFLCTGDNSNVCNLINTVRGSNMANCSFVEYLYTDCVYQFTFQNNKWINVDNCEGFQTTQSSPTQGIQCDESGVYGHKHPYYKKFGNVVYGMLYSLTLIVEFQDGLWCSKADLMVNCQFNTGGMFTTTSVRKLFFNGYNDASILKYLNLKHEINNIKILCKENPYDICGKQNYVCTSPGLELVMPNNKTKHLEYGITMNEEYFVPSFIITINGDLLWPLSSDQNISNYAIQQMQQIEYVEVRNPHFALYPAQNNMNESKFNQYYQCQKRQFFGPPNEYKSCFDTLLTGRDDLHKLMDIIELHGNQTVYPFLNGTSVQGSTLNNQYYPYLWDGFRSYPYNYLGKSAGSDFYTTETLDIYNKQHGMHFKLSQKSLIFDFQRDISLAIPASTGTSSSSSSSSSNPIEKVSVRRFVEDDDTWKEYHILGAPKDSYGMPHTVPIGMASLEKFTGFPLYLDTPNAYGNYVWGGIEYSFVSNTIQHAESQRTYLDYDPVTGKAIRSVERHQINLRVEAGPMFPNIFSSGKRCIAPTKTFASASGYGCWAYIPLIWYEDTRLVDSKSFFQLYYHYYTRPNRASVLTTTGIILGVIFMTIGIILYVSEDYHRRRFKARVYID